MPAKSKKSKVNKPSKFSQFSYYKNKQFAIIAIVVIAVAGIGTYMLSSSSAASTGSLSCTISATPSIKTVGTTVSVKVTYKNIGGSYWNGSVTPMVAIENPTTGSRTSTKQGSVLSGLVSGQTASRTISYQIPSGASGKNLKSYTLTSNTSLSSNCYQTWRIAY